MNNTFTVVKRDGSIEPLDISKATASLTWATHNIQNVSVSDIEMQSKLHFFDGIHTTYIEDIFIKTCDDLADLRNPNYDTVARNLKVLRLYKRVFGDVTPPSLRQFLTTMVESGHYHHDVLDADLDYLGTVIDHNLDFTFTSSGFDSLVNGYGLSADKQPLESPQFMFMAIAITAFHDYHITPLRYIEALYHGLSQFKLTLPSPEMRALRTGSFDIASCIIIEMGDSIDSWNEASAALVSHTTSSAGVGMDIAGIASLGDKVKNGTITHSGKIPVIKSIDADIGKASQNGRRGSATAYVNFFDPEIETIFALKSPRMPAEDRINDMSYGIKVNQVVYDRAINGGKLSLFSTRVATKLAELFYSSDIGAFTAYYEQCEADGLATAEIDARDFFIRSIAVEATETSAYYIINIDEINSNTPHLDPIKMANICIEYMAPTKPLSSTRRHSPDIGVCVLGNLNQGLIPIEQLPHYTNIMVRLQTHLMAKQQHPTPQANEFVRQYRDIGIGISNHAFWLASQSLRYGTPEALLAHDEWMEHFSFNLIKASMELAKEIGQAPALNRTNWRTHMPINRYNRNVDKLVSRQHSCDWNWLQQQVSIHGMANCGLAMVPPAETSAGPSNQTTGLEPIKDLLTIKDKQGTNYKQFAPLAIKLADKYEFAYDRNMNIPFIKHLAVTQKWIDKGISGNVFHNPEWNNGKVIAKDIIHELYIAKHYGVKGRYYHNTKIEDANDVTDGCAGGGCSV